MPDQPTPSAEPYYKDGEYGFHDHPESEADRLRRQLNECHRQHESVIERLDDAKAQITSLRAAVAEAEKQRDEAQVLFSDERYSHAKTLRLLSDTSVARDALAAKLAEARKVVEKFEGGMKAKWDQGYDAGYAAAVAARVNSRDACGGGGE